MPSGQHCQQRQLQARRRQQILARRHRREALLAQRRREAARLFAAVRDRERLGILRRSLRRYAQAHGLQGLCLCGDDGFFDSDRLFFYNEYIFW